MIVGTAGHIDHGKTALVRALTGVDADRLKEEKARGITIELGFAYADLAGGAITGFVDVPGHERLIHPMLAGAGGIDFALLVVAADDGMMPQTREHLAILDLLGIRRGAVALTKADLADGDRRAAVTAEIRAALTGATLAEAPVLPVSAVTGEGIDDLAALLAAAEGASVERRTLGPMRLPVDRVFTLAGAGTIVTGTVLGGCAHVGDELVLSPTGLAARVRSIHTQNRHATHGAAGARCALGLAGERIGREAISRGDMVVAPALHAPTDRIDADLRLLASEPRPLAEAVPAHLHVGAVEVAARVVPLGGPIAPGASGWVQLVLARPIAAAALDRFILRDVSASRTLGGGRLVDLRAPRRRRRAPERLAHLTAAATPDAAAALHRLLAAPPYLVDLPEFVRDRALSEAAVARAVEGAERIGPLLLAPATLAMLRGALAARLAEFHAASPELQGIGRERLRIGLEPRLPGAVFPAFLRREAEAGRVDEIAHDHFFLRATTAEMVRLAAAASRTSADGWFTTARFRDGMQNSREVAIQILDFFDRHGVTVRRGDLRRIDPRRLRPVRAGRHGNGDRGGGNRHGADAGLRVSP
ncbi:MAG: selenocysteine-specific translation elongation factor [Amaricoccus sp.]|uniref:selenocysteine-specific translation elongation factor n=1 Tax=Amaricoccus sp. TaxID=1872485 RepID=UPI0039E6B686